MNLKKLMHESTESLLNLVFPRKCAFCHKITGSAELMCTNCRERIKLIEAADQNQTLLHADGCYSAFFYDSLIRDSLHRYKFSGLNSYSFVYSHFLAKCIDENNISCDIITWVPISRKRKRKRGYDQSELLAEELSRRFGYQKEKLLEKHVHNRTQSGIKSADERKTNVSGVYRYRSDHQINSKTILLVDDIVTTGSTLSECCRVLKLAGAEKIICLTVARTPLKNK